MTYIFDTNIIVSSITTPSFRKFIQQKYPFDENSIIISVVTEGELESISIQRKWGRQKLRDLQNVVRETIIYPIKVREVIDWYAKIDAYIQGKLSGKPLPTVLSSRNMGKTIYG